MRLKSSQQCVAKMRMFGWTRGALGKVARLTTIEKQAALTKLQEWSFKQDRDAITRQFLFKDFKQAWAWMNQVAVYADKNDHHPEWFNVYNRVDVTLTTHDCQGLSQKDVDLAQYMNDHFEKSK